MGSDSVMAAVRGRRHRFQRVEIGSPVTSSRIPLCVVTVVFLVCVSRTQLWAQDDVGDPAVSDCPVSVVDLVCERLEDGSVLSTCSAPVATQGTDFVLLERRFATGVFSGSSTVMREQLPGDAIQFHDVDAPPRSALEYAVVLFTGEDVCNELGVGSPVGCLSQVPFRRGDQDGNGVADITDAINNLCSLMIGCGIVVCAEAADIDNSGAIDITDAINLLANLFFGSVGIPPPGAVECGPDPEYEI